MEPETEKIRFYALANGCGQRILKTTRHELIGPPNYLVEPYLDYKIEAFMEQRQHFWTFQPESWMTYHVSTILEVDCPRNEKLFILIERIDDKLEIMFGVGYVPRSFMLEFRATGKCRQCDRCFQQPRQAVKPRVTVRRLFEWFGNNLARRWQPYHILHANCQHVAEEVQRYVRDPSGTCTTVPTEEEVSASKVYHAKVQAAGMRGMSMKGSNGPMRSYRTSSMGYNSISVPGGSIPHGNSFNSQASLRSGNFASGNGYPTNLTSSTDFGMMKSPSFFSNHDPRPPDCLRSGPPSALSSRNSYKMSDLPHGQHPRLHGRPTQSPEEDDSCVVQ